MFIIFLLLLLNPTHSLIVQHEKTIYYEFKLPIVIPINISESYEPLSICYLAKVPNAKRECLNFICQNTCVYNLTIRQNILFTNYTLEISTTKEKKTSEFQIIMPTKPILKFEKFDFLEVSELLQMFNLTTVFVFNLSFSTIWYKQDILKYGIYYLENESKFISLDEKEGKTKDVINYSFSLSREKYDFLVSKGINKIYFVVFWNNEEIYSTPFTFKIAYVQETIEDVEEVEDFTNETFDYSDFKIMSIYGINAEEYGFFKKEDFELKSYVDKKLAKSKDFNLDGENALANLKSKLQNLKTKIDLIKRNYTIAFRDEKGKKTLRGDLFNVDNLTVCELEIERKDKAKIIWQDCLNLENFDPGFDVVVEDRTVIVNSKKVSFLNKPAIITIYNYTDDGFYIFKDGRICEDCELISFDQSNGILQFKVNGFSTYEVGYNATINLFGWNVQNTWFGVTGFRLNTTQSSSSVNQYHLISGNWNIHYGMRVFVINDSDPSTWRELTSGVPYLLFSKNIGNTSTSYQTAYWNCPGIDSVFNNSLYILIYGQIDTDSNPNTWQDTATWGLIYEPFLAVKILPTQWNVTLYTRRRYTSSTYIYFYTGLQYAQFRNITIGYAKINVSFVPPTPPNNSEVSTLDLYVQATGSPIFRNLTVNIFNATGSLVRSNFTTLNELNWTLSDLPDGVYFVNATAFDAVGYQYYSETRRYVIDRSIPYITLLEPTPQNEEWFNYSTIIINVSVESTNFANSTIWIYNTTSLYTSFTSYSANYFQNFTLPDGTYFFNVTALSATGKFSTTETRKIYIDTLAPIITINSPQNNSEILADFIIVNYSVIETNLDHVEIRVYDSQNNLIGFEYEDALQGEISFAGLTSDNYTIIATAHDRAGNSNTVTIFVKLDASTLDFCDLGYYRNISITNTASETTNYTVRVVVNTQTLISQNKMKPDCSDVRFTDSDGITPLSYWLEPGTCNTTNTVFWVKIPSLPVGTKFIYIFYYSPALITASNLYKAFEQGYVDAYSWVADSTWGSGSTNNADPYNTVVSDVRDQVIYIKSSAFQNYEPILVERIGFRRSQAPGRAIANFRIRYQYTTSTSFPTATFTSGGWILFYGPVTHTPIAEWNQYSGKPFLWLYNNLMLDISKDDTTTANNGGMYRKNIGVSNIICYFSRTETRSWPFDGTCTRSNFVPTIRFYGLVRKKLSTEPTVTVNAEIPIYDVCLPSVTYNAPANNSFLNYTNVLLNATPWYPTLKKLTVYFYGDGNLLTTYTDVVRGTNLTYLWQNLFTEKLYNWSVIVSDGIRNSTTSFNFFTIDLTKPQISFVAPTPANNSVLNNNNVTINVTITDTNFENVTISLYNSTGLVSSVTSTNSIFNYTFTNLADGVYYVNATAFDKAGNFNSTETRTFTIDTTLLILTFVPPTFDNDSMFNLKKVNYSFINFTIQGPFAEAKIEWNGQNYTVTCQDNYCYRNFTDLTENTYYYKAYAKTPLGVWWSSEQRVLYLNWWIPIYDEFKNYSETTNFRNYDENTIIYATNVKLQNENGTINWITTVNAYGADYDDAIEFKRSNLTINYTKLHSSHNDTIKIIFSNISVIRTPIIFVDDEFCSQCYVEDFAPQDFVIVNIPNMLAYNNDGIFNMRVVDVASLDIWDDSDNKTKIVNENITFYASYRDFYDNLPQEAQCTIYFYNQKTNTWINDSMQFNNTNNLWYYRRSFDSKYYTKFKVKCSSLTHYAEEKEDSIRIMPIMHVNYQYDHFNGTLRINNFCDECYYNVSLYVKKYGLMIYSNPNYDELFENLVSRRYVWKMVQNVTINYTLEYLYSLYNHDALHRIFVFITYLDD